MVFGGHLDRAWGSAWQRGCHGGNRLPFHPSSTSHQPRPCPGRSHWSINRGHGPTNSAWVIMARADPGRGGAGVRASARPPCAGRATRRGSEAGARHPDRHGATGPGSTVAGVTAAARRGPATSSTGFLSCQRSAGERRSWQPLRSDGLWRHLPRKPRRKRDSPGGLRRDFFGIAREPPACLIFPNTSRNSYQLLRRW